MYPETLVSFTLEAADINAEVRFPSNLSPNGSSRLLALDGLYNDSRTFLTLLKVSLHMYLNIAFSNIFMAVTSIHDS